ncbi:unnamed protein product [Spirodela intermedia]|uniref:Uncharacterized protein n=1 Tax=Spirodela intermedia TaxID=51605 RepID=A0A7I8J4N9_SPIIN|nr:unnamed protein product [Spirodela intermedia]CAA6664350.1 unnamed protein product [Spirodela intermedia]
MSRGKIKIRKIDNTTARQVTFRNELAILCDAQVGVIVSSSTGKLYEHSSNSMKELIERRNRHSQDALKLAPPSLELRLLDSIRESRSKEVLESTLQLRQMKGEGIEGLTLEELQNLEKALETGLCRVLARKGQQMAEEIKELQHKVGK